MTPEQQTRLEQEIIELKEQLEAQRTEVLVARKYTNCANLLGEINEALNINMFFEPAGTTLERVKELKAQTDKQATIISCQFRQLRFRAEELDKALKELVDYRAYEACIEKRDNIILYICFASLVITLIYLWATWKY